MADYRHTPEAVDDSPDIANRMLRFVLGSREASLVVADERREHLETLAALVAEGVLMPAIERTWPLAETAAAMQHVVSGRTHGKVVVEVGS